MHILFALAGLHRVRRGAEVVFESVAQEIALHGDHRVTLIGAGEPLPGRAYSFCHIPATPRDRFENWPKLPFLRNEFMYEELTFAKGLLSHPAVGQADITVTCGYPYTNWALRCAFRRKRRPHVFVTQNGDWPATTRRWEPFFFSCDGLICTNPIYYERNHERWRSTLIPNGVDPTRFYPGPGNRARLGLPTDRQIVLMVSALQAGKRVLEAIRAVARVPGAYLVVAGDGPLREEVDRVAARLLPDRFKRATFPHDMMPDLYRSADVFLHMTIGEPFGNVYIESLSSGIPVVAHDEALTRWILGEYAKLVDTMSEDQLLLALNDTLRLKRSDAQEAAVWAHANYGWSEIAGKYLEFLMSVANGH